MLTQKDLFYRRLKHEWIFQYKVLKTTINHWSVWIYILIPIVLIIFNFYFSLWNIEYNFDIALLNIFLYFFLFYFCWSDLLVLFIEFGDQLLLKQSSNWLNSLYKMGIYYSLLKSLLLTTFLFIILFPIFFLYLKLSLKEIFFLFQFVYVFHINLLFIKHLINLFYQSWKRSLVYLFAIIISIFIYLSFIFLYREYWVISLVIIIILIFTFLIQYNKRLSTKWCIYEDSIRRFNQKIRYAKFLNNIFAFYGGEVIPKDEKNKTQPLLFRKSNIFLKDRSSIKRLAELYIKLIFRKSSYLFMLIQIVLLFLFGIITSPLELKIFIWFISILLITNYLKWIINEVNQHDLFKLFPLNYNIRKKAVKTSIYYISLPFILVVSIITGLIINTIWLSIILILAGTLIAYVTLKYFVS